MKHAAEVITFKVDAELARELDQVPNRSAFIRSAVLAALGNTCPLCQGSGILSVSQQSHWNQIAEHHHMAECSDCHETVLVCDHEAGT